jgi:hypothetical protein
MSQTKMNGLASKVWCRNPQSVVEILSQLGGRKLRTGINHPQRSQNFLRTPQVVAVTCRRSRGVLEKALLWPGGVLPSPPAPLPQGARGEKRCLELGEDRPSPGRADDLHLPEPASGGNVWFWFRSCLV